MLKARAAADSGIELDWDYHIVSVLNPDAFLRGLGGSLLDELLAVGLRDVITRVVHPGSLLIDAIRDDLATQKIFFGAYRYRALDQLWSLGPSLAILFEGPSDVHRRVTALKGSGALEKAPPSSLRRRYRSVNTILGLMHASDNPQEAELDWRTFFARDWLNTGNSELPSVSRAGDARTMVRLLDRPPGGREERDFRTVREQFRRTLLGHIWDLLPPVVASTVSEALDRSGDADLPPELLRHASDSLKGRADLLIRRALASAFTPDDKPLDTDRLWRLLDGNGFVVDPWSRAVLSTSQYFPPVTYDDGKGIGER